MSQMIHINVVLPNGHSELLTLEPSSTLQELKTEAAQAFQKKYLKLITAVNLEQTLEETEMEDGEYLTALVLQPQLTATSKAFALWCHGDSAIVTWGDADFGGDSSAVQDQLKGVQQIQTTDWAFCCSFGRCIRRYLGSCRHWRWQFGSSGSAQGCAADSSLT